MTPLHFTTFFPQYAPTFHKFTAGPCRPQLTAYLNPSAPTTCDYVGCLSGRVVHCLLANATESTKANMAAAAVLLGLLPTTLSLVGSNTVETGVLALRRPGLAALLAAGTPAVAPMRLFDYADAGGLLGRRGPTVGGAGGGGDVEYLAAAAAVANVAHLSYLIGVQAVCSFSSETVYHPPLWAALAVVLHAWGAWTVRMRNFVGLAAREFRTCYCGSVEGKLKLAVKDRTAWFIFCTWITSIGTVAHIIYGTLIFSSILFVSTSDAVKIVARFVASTVVCRVILVFEITGMQQRVEPVTGHPGVYLGSGSGTGPKELGVFEAAEVDNVQTHRP
ncbi:hypothetical protein NEMBOFW57_004482 [Staphylotrichum longicolle]|uniref:Uncharacterized protein n=1 Tax=Staphylotrichum longicolle TaxID=669026 RepID=A0AAD4F7H8_9PEZI|nr:hypothetical protein NEMBOFW57_004482 [Staphylotrichum longicolle]